MMARRSGRSAALSVLGGLVSLVMVAGCGPTMKDLPLPGSGVSGETITVRITFADALNLAQGAPVKINGVAAGRVESVQARDFKAIALLKVRKSAQMRASSTARLRYTTPLGELFVDVSNPAHGAFLRDGASLPERQSSTAPTVEDSLASASLLINGGGLSQLQVVTAELNKAIGGREQTVRQLLDRSNAFFGSASATTTELDRTLTALAALSRTLNLNKATINAALRDIRPAAKVLRENTPQFARLLRSVEKFARTANGVASGSRRQVLQMLRQVTPVLDEFLSTRANLGPSLRDLVTVGKIVNKIIPGDYANMRLTILMDQVHLPIIGTPGQTAPTGPAGPMGPTLPKGLTGLLGGGLLGGLSGPAKPGSGSSPLSLSGLLGGAR